MSDMSAVRRVGRQWLCSGIALLVLAMSWKHCAQDIQYRDPRWLEPPAIAARYAKILSIIPPDAAVVVPVAQATSWRCMTIQSLLAPRRVRLMEAAEAQRGGGWVKAIGTGWVLLDPEYGAADNLFSDPSGQAPIFTTSDGLRVYRQ